MKKSLYITILLIATLSAKAQQVGMYNHYFYKPLFYNPAFSGNNEVTEAMMLNRTQWTSFNNAPQLNILTVDGLLQSQKVGLGLTLISDRRGINKRSGGNISYAYRLKIGEEAKLLFGISAGMISHVIDFSKAFSESTNDPTLFTTQQQKTSFDGNAGIVFVWKGLEVAASVPQIIGNKFSYVDNTAGIRTSYVQSRHFMSSVKYKIPIVKEKEISLSPLALVRIVPGGPMQYDANLNLDWKNKFWVGATYKSNYAVSANAGICLYKQLSIGYSYEFLMGNLSKYAGLSHEIIVNFSFGKKKKSEEPEPQVNNHNEIYEHKIDSLHTELTEAQQKEIENQKKIAELSNKLKQIQDQQKNQVVNNTTTNNTNTGNQTNTGINNETKNVSNETTTAANNNTGNSKTTNTNKAENKNTSNQTNSNNSNSELKNNGNTSTEHNNSNQNTNAVAQNKNKTKENNTWIVSSTQPEFTTTNNKEVKKGYYIIAGTFFYQDFAQEEAKRFKEKGFGACGVIYSKTQNFNYVFIYKVSSKEEALLEVKNAQNKGIKDAWIQIIK
jgi:type IX secretion system PorP/SprF family membrane protein